MPVCGQPSWRQQVQWSRLSLHAAQVTTIVGGLAQNFCIRYQPQLLPRHNVFCRELGNHCNREGTKELFPSIFHSVRRKTFVDSTKTEPAVSHNVQPGRTIHPHPPCLASTVCIGRWARVTHEFTRKARTLFRCHMCTVE